LKKHAQTTLKLIPLALALVFLLVPPMSSYAVNPPVEFQPPFNLNDIGETYVWDIATSDDIIHWIFTDGDGFASEELYYQKSISGSDETQILISNNTQSQNQPRATVHAWDNYVIITYEIDDGGSFNDLRAVLSTDSGDTFGTEYFIFDNNYDTGNNALDLQNQGATIIDAEDGDLYLIWYDRLASGNMSMLHSTDNGLTWTDRGVIGGFEEITNNHDFPSMSDNGIHVEGNIIHVAMGGNNNDQAGNNNVYYNRSDDDGVSWLYEEPDLIQILSTVTDDQDDYNPDIEVNGDNILITWTGDANTDLEYAFSTDGGDTFNTENIISNGCTNWGQPNYDWATSSVGDFAMYGCTGQGNLFTTNDMGATWSTINSVGFTVNHWHSDSSSNSIAFLSQNVTGTAGSTLYYATEPTSFADFDQVLVFTASVGSSVENTPNVSFTTDGIYVTRTQASNVNTIIYFAPYESSPPDAVPPVISATVSEPITILQDEPFDAFEFVQCIDDVDGDISDDIKITCEGGGSGDGSGGGGGQGSGSGDGSGGGSGGSSCDVDTSVRGLVDVDYQCKDGASNQSNLTIQYIVKQISSGGGGGSSSSSSSSGGITSTNNIPQLSDIPVLSFSNQQTQQTQQESEGRSISDIFASLFDNRITEGITTPSPSVSSGSPAPTQTSNPIADFFQNLFSRFFS